MTNNRPARVTIHEVMSAMLLIAASACAPLGAGGMSGAGGGGAGAGGAGGGAQNPQPNGIGLDSDWAQWPMPNIPVDVALGAPNMESYLDNGDGTVTDAVTGLMWQQSPLAGDGAPFPTFVWGEPETPGTAQNYCQTLSLAGHVDWRLPSFIELYSIAEPSTPTVPTPQSLNPRFFPGVPSRFFWTSTVTGTRAPLGPLSSALTVDSSSGSGGGFNASADGCVRCVRNTIPQPVNPPQRYSVNAGMVSDSQTRLVWQQSATDRYTWDSTGAAGTAQNHCATLVLGDLSWRLPTLKELMTLVDFSRTSGGTIDPVAFPDTAADSFWTSTPGWSVFFYDGATSQFISARELAYVRCVSAVGPDVTLPLP